MGTGSSALLQCHTQIFNTEQKKDKGGICGLRIGDRQCNLTQYRNVNTDFTDLQNSTEGRRQCILGNL